MSSSSRNFTGLNVTRSQSTSVPASDLTEKILAKLEEVGPSPLKELTAAIGGDPVDVQGRILVLLNLKLVEKGKGVTLQVSAAGKSALASNLLSISASTN